MSQERLPNDTYEMHYPDNGCWASLTCLTCPLPKCKYDMTLSEVIRYRSLIKGEPTITERVTMLENQGKARHVAVTIVAKEEGVATRTIHRWMDRE